MFCVNPGEEEQTDNNGGEKEELSPVKPHAEKKSNWRNRRGEKPVCLFKGKKKGRPGGKIGTLHGALTDSRRNRRSGARCDDSSTS